MLEAIRSIFYMPEQKVVTELSQTCVSGVARFILDNGTKLFHNFSITSVVDLRSMLDTENSICKIRLIEAGCYPIDPLKMSWCLEKASHVRAEWLVDRIVDVIETKTSYIPAGLNPVAVTALAIGALAVVGGAICLWNRRTN